MTSPLAFRIYYEDTDAGGVVYYANYLRFLERARTETLRSLGVEQGRLLQHGIAFAVRTLTAEYLKPARLDDMIHVSTAVEEVGRAQVVFRQRIDRGGTPLVDAKVRVACIDTVRGKAVAMPKEIHEKFASLMGGPA